MSDFFSYTRSDKTQVESLTKLLRDSFGASARYDLALWNDRKILARQPWHQEIQAAIGECDFGLLLISPAFLGNQYITRHELPKFVATKTDSPEKPVIPVGLVPVNLDIHDLKGLQHQQIFYYSDAKIEGRCYNQLTSSAKKQAFVNLLHQAIEKRLDAWFGVTPSSEKVGIPPAPRLEASCVTSVCQDVGERIPAPPATKYFMRTKGLHFALGDLESLDTKTKTTPGDQARDAMSEIEAWAVNPNSPPFFALLGEYGIGKTTTLKHPTRALLEKRRSNPSVPLPIYIDLRDYSSQEKEPIPTIEQLLASVTERSWKLTDRSVKPADILQLVRENGALILFDGLDEKIVSLPSTKAQEFIRTLWAVLPDASRRIPGKGDPIKKRGKLLISCRSHYFRDVRSQNAMLVGGDRKVLKEDFRTATFVLRHNTEEKHFRFAHTSLQEYFLASFLVRVLEDGAGERWDLPMVSLETLDFVGQIAPGCQR